MTIQTQSNKTIALGNGVTTQFAFDFIGVAAAFITVILTDSSGNETVLSRGSGSTQYQIALNAPVAGATWGVGGIVTYDPSGTPIPAGSSITIFRTLPLTQAQSLQSQNSLSTLGSGTETGLDTIEMQLQQVAEGLDRAIIAPVVDPPTISLVLPPAAQRANTSIAFDSFGNVIAGTAPATGLISTAMQPVVDAASLALGRAAFGLGNIATQNIGSGLQNDGAGGVRVNSPVTQVATSQIVDATFDLNRYAATGPINFALPRASTLFNGFSFWVEAISGDVTLLLNPNDSIDGGLGSGIPFTIPAGAAVRVTTDGALNGLWYIDDMPWLAPDVRTNGVSGTYNITASDNAKILKNNSGSFGTFIFPAAASLPSNFRCMIINGETTPIGKGVGGTDVGSFTMYPGQAYLVLNDNGTMRLVGGIQPYKVNTVALFCDASSGNDDPLVTDGLSGGNRAKKTQLISRQQLYSDFNHNGSHPSVTLNGTFNEVVTFSGQPPNAGVFFWGGSSPGSYKINATGNGVACLEPGDGTTLEINNIVFDGNGFNAVAIQLHQTAIIDVLGGCTFGPFGTGNHLATDGAGWTLNLDNDYSVTGGASFHANLLGSGVLNQSGATTVTIGPSLAFVAWFKSTGPILLNLGGGIAFGTIASGFKWQIGPASYLSTAGNTIPGTTAGNPTIGAAPSGTTGWVS